MIFKGIDIKKLLQLMQEHDVAEIALKNGKSAIEVKRTGGGVMLDAANSALVQSLVKAPGIDVQQAKAAPMDTIHAAEEGAAPAGEGTKENYHIVEAPLVGTFYRAPAPDADPFVNVGDRVNKGDVLCIVEAMKSMNEIQADAGGVIKEICLDDAELVEFEQPLFKIETSG